LQIDLTLWGIVLYLFIYQANTLELTYEEKQKMTRKDYVLIAEAICNTRTKAKWQDVALDENTLKATAQAMAQLLEYDNPRFDRDRFLTACGVK